MAGEGSEEEFEVREEGSCSMEDESFELSSASYLSASSSGTSTPFKL